MLRRRVEGVAIFALLANGLFGCDPDPCQNSSHAPSWWLAFFAKATTYHRDLDITTSAQAAQYQCLDALTEVGGTRDVGSFRDLPRVPLLSAVW